MEEELKNKFNPEGSTLREQQKIMLYILESIDNICKKNNINYWLCSGTLLGATRHKGFIPWDDDLDIEMLEEDYLKLLAAIKKDGLPNGLVIQNRDTDTSYIYPFPKIRHLYSRIKESNKSVMSDKFNGIFVDIFTINKTNSRVSKFSYKLGLIYYYFAWKEKRTSLIKAVSFMLYICLYKVLFPILNSLVHLIHKGDENGHPLGMPFKYYPRHLKEIFPLKPVSFEEGFYPSPCNSDAYLTRIYGNYMKIPDISKIRTHLSDIEIFKKETE